MLVFTPILRTSPYISNVFIKFKVLERKKIKKKIRRLQRLKQFNDVKHQAINLEKMFDLSREKFWSKVKSFRQKQQVNKKLNVNG